MKVIGKDTARVDGRALATGQPVFADDIELKNVLHCKVLHSDVAHARIKRIDASAARSIPGIVAVYTHEDFNQHYYTTAGQGYPEPGPRDYRILDDTVRYVGDRVALVTAETLSAAQLALTRIKVEYEKLPAVFDPREALTGQVVVHPEAGKSGIHDCKHNIACHIAAEVGDVAAAFADADHVFEGEYSTPFVQQAHIEPHICLSWRDEHNRIVIRSATQVPFHARRIVAEVLGLDVGQVRVIKPRVGGAFGGKQEILNEELVAAVTLKTGRPARLEYTREEEFYAARCRHPQITKFKIAVDEDHRLQAIDLKILENSGSYGAHALTVMSVTAQKVLSLYRAPNLRVHGDAVYTNLPIAGAYRGYGAPQGFFGLEVLMDEIAAELKIDPIKLRHKNYVQVGDDLPIAAILGEGREGFPAQVRSTGLHDCLEEGKKLIDWDAHRNESKSGTIRKGVGVAAVGQGSGIPGIDMGSAFIKMNEDASFNLLVGATDLGTGSDTVLAQIAAEEIGVPVEKIIVYSSDTDRTPFDTGAYASSTTYISGAAVRKAAKEVKRQILDLGKKLLAADEAEIRDGQVVTPAGASLSFGEICTKTFYTEEQTQIMATASHMSFDSPSPYNATFAAVSVDTATGLVTVDKVVSVTDSGQVINPRMAEGQVEGAIPQSLGMTLSEFMVFDGRGRPVNTDFNQYHIYTAIDMPEIVARFVHTHEPTGPYGAKAAAEIPINGPAPAVVNAIYNACGVRIRELPVTPEAILEGLKNL